jgi:hypothetical protein
MFNKTLASQLFFAKSSFIKRDSSFSKFRDPQVVIYLFI